MKTLQETLTRLRDERAEEYCNKIDHNVAAHFREGFNSAQYLLLPLIEKMKLALVEIEEAYPNGNPKWMNSKASETLSELKKLEEGLGK